MPLLNPIPQQGFMPTAPRIPQDGKHATRVLQYPTGVTTQKIATPATRFWAFLLDSFLPLIVMIPSVLIFRSGASYMPSEPTSAILVAGAPFILVIVLHFYLLANRSQSIGKFLTNIQVVNMETDKRETFWRMLILRQFIGTTLVIGAIPILNVLFQPFYFLLDSLFIFSEKNRTLHDMIGGTIVVELPAEQQRKSLFDFAALP